MSERSQNELTMFEQGVLLTLTTLVCELKDKGALDAKRLEELHAQFMASPPHRASDPLDISGWESGISPLKAYWLKDL